MNILEQEDLVKGLPDQILIRQAQMPTGEISQFLVVSELDRRQKMRKGFAERVPEGTVAERVVSEGIAAMNPNPDPLMTMAMGAQPPLLPPSPPMSGQPPPPPMPGQPPQDPMMPPQDPMIMAAGGGMMPYPMYDGRSTTDVLRDAVSRGMSQKNIAELLASAQNILRPAEYASFLSEAQNLGLDISEFAAPPSGYSEDSTITSPYIPYGSEFDDTNSINKILAEARAINPTNREDILSELGASPVSDRIDPSGNYPTVILNESGLKRVNAPPAEYQPLDNDPFVAGIGSARTNPQGEALNYPISGIKQQNKYPFLQETFGPSLGRIIGDATPEAVFSGLESTSKSLGEASDVVGRDMQDLARFLGTEGMLDKVEPLSAAETGRRGEEFLSQYFGLRDDGTVLFKGEPIKSPFPKPSEKPFFDAGESFEKLLAAFPISSFGGKGFGLTNANKEDVAKANEEDLKEAEELIIAEDASDKGPKVNPNVADNKDVQVKGGATDQAEDTPNDLMRSAAVVGTDEDSEKANTDLIQSLFGRSYEPTDKGALALVNLGAGIAKGDIGGGLQSAAKAIGDEEDRRRKAVLSAAQAKYYESALARSKGKSSFDMYKQARLTLANMSGLDKADYLSKITGRPVGLNEVDGLEETLLNYLATEYAKQTQIPASALVGLPRIDGEPSQRIPRDLTNEEIVMFSRKLGT